jgi:hypothetical protein
MKMKKKYFTLFFLIPFIHLSQTKFDVSYNSKVDVKNFKCYYCGIECSKVSILKISELSDFKAVGCLIREGFYFPWDCYNKEYTKCKSALNKTDNHDLRVNNSETKIINNTLSCDFVCQDEATLNDKKSYFEADDFEKFRSYCFSIEKKEKETHNKNLEELENSILIKDFENAAMKYAEISKSKYSDDPFLKGLKETIQIGLNNSINVVISLSQDDMQSIISNNRQYFNELFKNKISTVEIIFDQNGFGYVNNEKVNIKNLKLYSVKEIGNFKVYCKSKGTFQLSTEQIQNPNKMYYDIWVAPNQKISKNGNKYFKKTFLSASVFKDEVSVINDNQVPYGKYWMVKHELKLSKVNGIEINREELLIKDSEKNLSRRLGMKIARGTSSLAILTWLTLRFIEFSSVK